MSQSYLADVKLLFASYPFKKFHLDLSKIDRQKLIDMYAENFYTDDIHKLTIENNSATGLISLQKFSSLSDFFQLNAYFLKNFISSQQESGYRKLLDSIFTFEKTHEVNFIITRQPVDNVAGINALLKHGFYYVATETLYDLDLNKIVEIDDTDFSSVEALTEMGANTIANLQRIASNNHHDNRYLYDDFFNPNEVKRFYETVITSSVTNKNHHVFVYRDNGSVCGFIITIINPAFNDKMPYNYGSLDYIVVDSKYQSNNIGSVLNNYGLSHFKQQDVRFLSVKTTGSNYRAMRLLSKNKFIIGAQNAILHWRKQ